MRYMILAIATLLLSISMATTTRAQVHVEIDNIDGTGIDIGSILEVKFSATSGFDINGWQLGVSWDSFILQADSFELGTFVSNLGLTSQSEEFYQGSIPVGTTPTPLTNAVNTDIQFGPTQFIPANQSIHLFTIRFIRIATTHAQTTITLENNQRGTGFPTLFFDLFGVGTVPTSSGGSVTLLPVFSRIDCNDDGAKNIGDVQFLLNVLFIAPIQQANCMSACDSNDDGSVNIGDNLYMLSVLFNGAPAPAPFTGCGLDPTPDSITCNSYNSCP